MKEQMIEAFESQKFKVFSPFKCDISKDSNGNYVEDETIFAFAWFVRGYQAALSALSAVPANHSEDALKMVQAVNALAAQTGESPESITEWLTDKGGLTTLMLSHFGGKAQQPAQEPVLPKAIIMPSTLKEPIQVPVSEPTDLSVSWHVRKQPAQEPVKQEPYAYDVPTKFGTELAYAIYFTKYGNKLPEGAIPLYLEAQHHDRQQ
jgi:hypothetical protein